MLIYYDDELMDIIADECADCEYSYVDDLYFEWMCKRKKCKYTKAEQQEILKKTKEKYQEDTERSK